MRRVFSRQPPAPAPVDPAGCSCQGELLDSGSTVSLLLGSTWASAGSEQLRANGSPNRSPVPLSGHRGLKTPLPNTDLLLLLLPPSLHKPCLQQVSDSSSSPIACCSEAQTHAGSRCTGRRCSYLSPSLPRQAAPLS